MRVQVERLEQQLQECALRKQRHLAKQQQEAAATTNPSRDPLHTDDDADADPKHSTALYLQLVEETKRLQQEKRAMEALTLKHTMFHEYMTSLVASEPSTALETLEERTPATDFRPLDSDTCAHAVRRAYQTYAALDQCTTFTTSGASLLGWREKRRVVGDGTFQFALYRSAAHHRAFDLMNRTWEIYSTPRLFETLFRGGNTKVRIPKHTHLHFVCVCPCSSVYVLCMGVYDPRCASCRHSMTTHSSWSATLATLTARQPACGACASRRECAFPAAF